MRKLIALGVVAVFASLLIANSVSAGSGDNKWVRVPGAPKAADIGMGTKGFVYTTEAKTGRVHRWNMCTQKWDLFSGNLARITADIDGLLWGVDSKNDIYHFNGKKWIRMPGKASDIGAGGKKKSLWVTGLQCQGYGCDIHRRMGNGWTKVPGNAVRLDVGREGRAWVVNSVGDVFLSPKFGIKWDKIGGKARDIAANSTGHVMYIRTDNYVITGIGRKHGPKPPGRAMNITLDRRGNPWIVDDRGIVYAWGKAALTDLLPTSWDHSCAKMRKKK